MKLFFMIVCCVCLTLFVVGCAMDNIPTAIFSAMGGIISSLGLEAVENV